MYVVANLKGAIYGRSRQFQLFVFSFRQTTKHNTTVLTLFQKYKQAFIVPENLDCDRWCQMWNTNEKEIQQELPNTLLVEPGHAVINW